MVFQSISLAFSIFLHGSHLQPYAIMHAYYDWFSTLIVSTYFPRSNMKDSG